MPASMQQRGTFPAWHNSWGRVAPDAVHAMADWVTDSGDNGGLPFVIVDKPDAKVFVFDKNGKSLGSAWVLIGLARR